MKQEDAPTKVIFACTGCGQAYQAVQRASALPFSFTAYAGGDGTFMLSPR
jgi:diacylglycerol kinase family enzyme